MNPQENAELLAALMRQEELLKQLVAAERWQILCEYITNYPTLTKSTQVKVIKLLFSLCFHQAVLEYVPPMSAAEIASDSDNATLAFFRAMSNLMLHVDRYLPYSLKELETIAQNAPVGNIVRVSAGLQVLVELAKTWKDLEGAQLWRSIVEQDINSKPKSFLKVLPSGHFS